MRRIVCVDLLEARSASEASIKVISVLIQMAPTSNGRRRPLDRSMHSDSVVCVAFGLCVRQHVHSATEGRMHMGVHTLCASRFRFVRLCVRWAHAIASGKRTEARVHFCMQPQQRDLARGSWRETHAAGCLPSIRTCARRKVFVHRLRALMSRSRAYAGEHANFN